MPAVTDNPSGIGAGVENGWFDPSSDR